LQYLSNNEKLFTLDVLSNDLSENFSNFSLVQIDLCTIDVTVASIQGKSVQQKMKVQ
jgi:hypothetical protein